jgi:hypothetical protein
MSEFTDINNIHKFYGHGLYLREIFVPADSELDDLIVIKNPVNDTYRSNKILLGRKYPLWHPDTYTKFGLDICDNYDLIDCASRNGRLDILDWWVRNGIDLKFSHSAVDSASANGHIAILNWWKEQKINNKLEFKYSENALDSASKNQHLDVLTWWLSNFIQNPFFELRYSERAINWASFNGHIDILNWWRNTHKTHGIELKYTAETINYAAINEDPITLNWWMCSDLKPKFTDFANNTTNSEINILLKIIKSIGDNNNAQQKIPTPIVLPTTNTKVSYFSRYINTKYIKYIVGLMVATTIISTIGKFRRT